MDTNTAKKLAEAAWERFVPANVRATGQKAWVNVKTDKLVYGFEGTFTERDMLAHMLGEAYWAIQPCQGGKCAWLGIDLDGRRLDLLHTVASLLSGVGVPVVASYSGRKGHHLTCFYSRDASRQEHSRIRAMVKRLLDSRLASGDRTFVDRVTSPDQILALPSGVHPITGDSGDFVDLETLERVQAAAAVRILEEAPTLDIESMLGCDEKKEVAGVGTIRTGELHPWRQCVNVIWREGLQHEGTRHSATCAVIAAILRNPEIIGKEGAILEWLDRTHLAAYERGLTKTDLEGAKADALRWYQRYANASYAVTCQNSVFAAALESACTPEARAECAVVALKSRGAAADWCGLLRTSGLWRKETLAAGYLYEAMAAISKKALESGGPPVVHESYDRLAEKAGIGRRTVPDALKVLERLGLVEQVAGTKWGTNPGRAIRTYEVPQFIGSQLVDFLEGLSPRPRSVTQDGDPEPTASED